MPTQLCQAEGVYGETDKIVTVDTTRLSQPTPSWPRFWPLICVELNSDSLNIEMLVLHMSHWIMPAWMEPLALISVFGSTDRRD